MLYFFCFVCFCLFFGEKGLLAEITKLRISRWEHLILSQWALTTITGVLLREGHWENGHTHRLWWQRQCLERCSHKPSNGSGHQKPAATRSWQRQGENCPAEPPETVWPADTLILGFLAFKMVKGYRKSVVLSHQICGDLLCSHRKWIHLPINSFFPLKVSFACIQRTLVVNVVHHFHDWG